MGMNYHLECLDCKMRLNHPKSSEVEFSVVDHVSLKHPDLSKIDLIDWTIFLVKHSGHKIALVDSKGNQTDPSKISGEYVLGLTDKPNRED